MIWTLSTTFTIYIIIYKFYRPLRGT